MSSPNSNNNEQQGGDPERPTSPPSASPRTKTAPRPTGQLARSPGATTPDSDETDAPARPTSPHPAAAEQPADPHTQPRAAPTGGSAAATERTAPSRSGPIGGGKHSKSKPLRRPDRGPVPPSRARPTGPEEETCNSSAKGREYTGYLQRDLLVSTDQRDFVNRVLKDASRPSRLFFVHVLISTLQQRKYWDGWIPVCSRLMRDKLPGAIVNTEREVWRPLVDIEALEVNRRYSRSSELSRTFKIPDPVIDGYLQCARGSEDRLLCQRDLATGKRKRPRPAQKTRVRDQNRHAYPALMDNVLRHLKGIRRLFNRPAVERHLVALKNEVADAEAAWRRSGGEEDTPEHKRYATAVRRLRNDESCWQAIRKQMPLPTDDMPDGIWQYVPAYRVQEISGRISEIGGGFQSCSRAMKHAAIEGIPGIRNYDIVSSQLYGLKEEFEKAGITTRQIDALLSRPKTEYAVEAGVSVDTWKRCLYAVVFHAALHACLEAALRAAERRDGKIPASPRPSLRMSAAGVLRASMTASGACSSPSTWTWARGTSTWLPSTGTT